MNYSGINMSDVRTKNKSIVLKLLNDSGDMSRKDISETLGLTPAAVSILTAELIEEGFVRESGKESDSDSSKAGRKKIKLTLCTDRFYAVSINVEKDNTCVSLVRLDGELISMRKVPTLENGKKSLTIAAESASEIIAESGIDEDSILGAGLGLVGSYDRKNDLILRFGLWENDFHPAEFLSRALNMNVEAENNVKAFAGAHMLFSKEQSKNLLFIKWSEGIGSAIIFDGKTVPGAQEIGHYITEHNSRICRCGRKGCIETVCTIESIAESVMTVYSAETTPILFSLTKGDASKIKEQIQVCDIRAIDDAAKAVILNRINLMARAAVNAATTMTPEKIILFGSMWSKSIFSLFVMECRKLAAFYKTDIIFKSGIMDKEDYIGPISLVSRAKFFLE